MSPLFFWLFLLFLMNLDTCKMLPWYACSLHCFSARLPQSRTEDFGQRAEYRHPPGYNLPLTLLKLLEGLSLAHTAGPSFTDTAADRTQEDWAVSVLGLGFWQEVEHGRRERGRGSTLVRSLSPCS